MKPAEYLKKAKNSHIKIIGLDGRVLQRMQPEKALLEAILDRRASGKVEFVDKTRFPIKRDMVISKAELWYDDTLVAFREFPDIRADKGDSLTITWRLSIAREGTAVEVES